MVCFLRGFKRHFKTKTTLFLTSPHQITSQSCVEMDFGRIAAWNMAHLRQILSNGLHEVDSERLLATFQIESTRFLSHYEKVPPPPFPRPSIHSKLGCLSPSIDQSCDRYTTNTSLSSRDAAKEWMRKSWKYKT
jgi:hypothetical protein